MVILQFWIFLIFNFFNLSKAATFDNFTKDGKSNDDLYQVYYQIFPNKLADENLTSNIEATTEQLFYLDDNSMQGQYVMAENLIPIESFNKDVEGRLPSLFNDLYSGPQPLQYNLLNWFF